MLHASFFPDSIVSWKKWFLVLVQWVWYNKINIHLTNGQVLGTSVQSLLVREKALHASNTQWFIVACTETQIGLQSNERQLGVEHCLTEYCMEIESCFGVINPWVCEDSVQFMVIVTEEQTHVLSISDVIYITFYACTGSLDILDSESSVELIKYESAFLLNSTILHLA